MKHYLPRYGGGSSLSHQGRLSKRADPQTDYLDMHGSGRGQGLWGVRIIAMNINTESGLLWSRGDFDLDTGCPVLGKDESLAGGSLEAVHWLSQMEGPQRSH